MAAASLLALSACKQTTVGGNESGNAAAGNATAAAGGGVNGTWKADVDSVQFDQKPDEYLLAAGQYSCKSCVPPPTVAADGAFHAITAPYADELSVKVDDDHNVTRTAKKGGRVVGETKMSVSGDGKTLTQSFTDTSVASAPAAKGQFIETRVAAGPAGSHAISGQWKPTKLANFNAEALTVSFNAEGDTLHMSSPTGQSYDAKIGGPDVAIKGDNAGTTASVKKTGDNAYEETDKRGGKIVNINTFSLGADGKLHFVSQDKTNGSTVKWTATRS
jgi:hypothetical protein